MPRKSVSSRSVSRRSKPKKPSVKDSRDSLKNVTAEDVRRSSVRGVKPKNAAAERLKRKDAEAAAV